MDGAIGKLKTMDDDTVISQTEACLKWLGEEQRPTQIEQVSRVSAWAVDLPLANAELANHFKGAAAFYGGGIGPIEDGLGRKTLLERVPEFVSPILLWYGSRISRYFLMN